MIICGTGHRPDKLGGYDDATYMRIFKVAYAWLEEKNPNLDGTLRVISGGALGWDQALAQAAYSTSTDYEIYLPFEGFDSKWPEKSRKHLDWLCRQADDYKYICEPGYAPWKMQKRNEAMVDAADLVLALWNGTPGGTANCIRYANKVGKPVVNLWDEYNEQIPIHP